MRLAVLTGISLAASASFSVAQERVEARSISASIKLEEVIYGHLTELNGKYKMRASEVTFGFALFCRASSPSRKGV
jgi:hypothetical protein